MGTVDVYRITAQLDDPTLDVVATRLEARGKHPRFMEMMREYLDAMDIDSCRSVLDLGCGTGVAARSIARRESFTGRITGLDVSPYLVAAAKRLSEQEGIGHVIDFRAGDSHSLGLPDGAFDAVVAHTLISHVEDPPAVLREMARVVRLGGTIAVFDGDYASIAFGGDDAVKGKADDELIINAVVTNPRVMRQMPHLMQEAGLMLGKTFSHVVADIGKADFWAPALESFVRLLPKAGAMTDNEAQAWVASMQKRSEEGRFFGAANFYSYIATRT